jgi:hypothetical protein
MALLFLLPVPAWAALTFTWTSGPSSNNPSLISAAPLSNNGATVNFTINSLGGPSDIVTLSGIATVTANPTGKNITADFSGWNGPINVGTNANLSFLISYNSGIIYSHQFLQGTTPGGAGSGNQFTGINPQPETASGTLLFSITMSGSYTTNSSTASLSFVEQ